MCSQPTLWLLIKELAKDLQKHKAAFIQGATGVQEIDAKKYCDLVDKVRGAVAGYS